MGGFFDRQRRPQEVNFVIFVNGEPGIWLKIGGLDEEEIYISILLAAKRHQHKGVGCYALQFAEKYTLERRKKQ